MEDDKRILTRAVEAILIPQGTPMELAEGENVVITHRLGGNFTIMTENGMFRIKGSDADALGEEIAINEKNEAQVNQGPPEMDALWTVLKKVFDPEIPVNIVDLGLVYSLEVIEEEGKHIVEMQMTLTAPGCGMGPAIAEDAQNHLETVSEVGEAKVVIVWDPPWDQEMITEEGKMILGLI
jgi:probable FeS assembly SUF system protein SufT